MNITSSVLARFWSPMVVILFACSLLRVCIPGAKWCTPLGLLAVAHVWARYSTSEGPAFTMYMLGEQKVHE